MERIYQCIATRAAHARAHPLFERIERIETKDIPRYIRIWSPQFIHLGMTFRDVCKMYFSYPQAKDAFEMQINQHAEIDSEHWKFLLADLEKIGVADQVNSLEGAVKMIWSDAWAVVRRYIYAFVSRAMSCGESPFLRVTCMEAGEATVKAFFTSARGIAKKFQDCTGQTLEYFGEAHIASELDHPIDDQLFRAHVLSDELAIKATALVHQHFDQFHSFLEHKHQLTLDILG